MRNPRLLGGRLPADSLLSRPPGRDIDVAVAGDSQALGRRLSKMLGGKFVPLSPTFGTARVVAPDPEGGTWTVDLSAFAGSIEEDLARRDFTINALALPLAHWGSGALGEELIDPFQGRKDLAEKCIRAVSRHAFQDDPCRLLRSVRLASALGFRLEPETARQVLADASHLGAVAVERVRDEFLSILALDGAKGSLEALDRLDLLCRIIPELAEAKGVDQPKMHYWDVWGHLLHAVENAERITKGHQTLTGIHVDLLDCRNGRLLQQGSRRSPLPPDHAQAGRSAPRYRQTQDQARRRRRPHSFSGPFRGRS